MECVDARNNLVSASRTPALVTHLGTTVCLPCAIEYCPPCRPQMGCNLESIAPLEKPAVPAPDLVWKPAGHGEQRRVLLPYRRRDGSYLSCCVLPLADQMQMRSLCALSPLSLSRARSRTHL